MIGFFLLEDAVKLLVLETHEEEDEEEGKAALATEWGVEEDKDEGKADLEIEWGVGGDGFGAEGCPFLCGDFLAFFGGGASPLDII